MLHQTDADYLKQVAYQNAAGLDIRNDILEQYRSLHSQGWYEWLWQRLTLPPHCTILDLGCGPADLWVKNRWRLLPGWRIVLADFSMGMVHEARERLELCSPEPAAAFHFVASDSLALPFPPQSWDAVIALGLLDHVADPQQALREIQRVLKPGGQFYASAGGRSHLQEIETLVAPFLPNVHFGGDPHRFGLDNGAELLAPYFPQVNLQRYQDVLIFSEPEPLLAFVLSEAEVKAQFTADTRQAWQTFTEQQLAQGDIRVTTEKGVFMAKTGKPVV